MNSLDVSVGSSNSDNAIQDASFISIYSSFLMPSNNLAARLELSSIVFILCFSANVFELSMKAKNKAAIAPTQVGEVTQECYISDSHRSV